MPGKWAATSTSDDDSKPPSFGRLGVGKHVVRHAMRRNHTGFEGDVEFLENQGCVL